MSEGINDGDTRSPKRPNQNVRSTSKSNFAEYLASRKHTARIAQIHSFLQSNGASSRKMISKGLKLDSNQVTQAVKDLIVKWNAAYELPEKRPCKVTGKTVYYVELKKSINILKQAG